MGNTVHYYKGLYGIRNIYNLLRDRIYWVVNMKYLYSIAFKQILMENF